MIIEMVGAIGGAEAEILYLADPVPPLANIAGALALDRESKGPHAADCRSCNTTIGRRNKGRLRAGCEWGSGHQPRGPQTGSAVRCLDGRILCRSDCGQERPGQRHIEDREKTEQGSLSLLSGCHSVADRYDRHRTVIRVADRRGLKLHALGDHRRSGSTATTSTASWPCNVGECLPGRRSRR